MPACYSTFLSKLSEKAVHNLSYETLKPIHQTFSSLASSDLDTIPTNILVQLQDSLILVLRTHEVEEVSTSLFSLAVLARLASWPGLCSTLENSAQASDANPSTVPQTLLPARQFFGPKRVSKTLDLVVLKAIMICSRNCTLTSNASTESLQLCVEIVRAVENSERSSWVTNNSGKVKKLYEKVLRSDIAREVQGAVSVSSWFTCYTYSLTTRHCAFLYSWSINRIYLMRLCLLLKRSCERFIVLLQTPKLLQAAW